MEATLQSLSEQLLALNTRQKGPVLEKLKSAGFTLRGSMCILGQTSITHLGFHYSAKGVTPSTDKAKSIAEWPTPTSTKELT